MPAGRIVAIANQKGGVGKTTTAVNLAVAIAELRRPVMLIDLDPQGNATSGLTRTSELPNGNRRSAPQSATPASPMVNNKTSIYDALVNRTPLSDIIRDARPGLGLACSSADLVGAEIELATMEGRERRLRDVLTSYSSKYDITLIDTPPSLGLLTLNALVAADLVLVPMQCEYYALEGLSSLLATIRKVKSVLNPKLDLAGIILTMFDSRNRLSHEISADIEKHFPKLVFQNVIPRSVRISESPSHGMSVIEYEPRSPGAEAYRALARELLERCGRPVPADAAAVAAEPAAVSAKRGLFNLRAIFARSAERGRKGE